MEQVLPHWLDVSAPSADLLASLAEEYSLHPTSIQDCLDPEHYPKIERASGSLFAIIRFYDHTAPNDADELLALTRKLSFFLTSNGRLITVHRDPQPFVEEVKRRLRQHPEEERDGWAILVRLMRRSLESFNPWLEAQERAIEDFERSMIGRKAGQIDLIQLYQIRGKLSVIKRLMWHSMAMIKELITIHSAGPSPWLQDLRETAEGQFQYVDELMEDTQNILSLHLALSSHRTNEVMRFLTVVSLFFMPLTFIVGLYGMNFVNMPELKWEWGYHITWGVMIAVSILIYWKVKQKGWLSRD